MTNTISTPIRLLYYLLLNNGKIGSNDQEAQKLRGNFPITITVSSAPKVIRQLLDIVALNAGIDTKEITMRLKDFSWCHQFKRIIKQEGSVSRTFSAPNPIKKSNFSGVFRRYES